MTIGFLICYEFESKLHLGNTDIDGLFEKVLALKGKHGLETLEKLSRIALQNGPDNEVTIQTLKSVIKCQVEQEKINFDKLSKTIHHLINISLRKGNMISAESKADAFNYYQDAIAIVDKNQNDYPEMEVVWLMTKSWNCGVRLYSAQHFDAAEKWCSMAMKFLKYLKNLKETYEPHMSGVFTDIISRIQQSRAQMDVEE